MREDNPTTVSKPVLSWFEKTLLKDFNNDQALNVGTHIIDNLAKNRNFLSFEEEDGNIRQLLGDIYAAK